MERKRLEKQPYSVVTEGDSFTVRAHDITRLAYVVASDHIPQPLSLLDGEIVNSDKPIDVILRTNEDKSGKTIGLYVDLETYDNVENFGMTLLNEIDDGLYADDEGAPLYVHSSEPERDAHGHTHFSFMFEDDFIVGITASHDHISVEANIPKAQLERFGELDKVDYQLQTFNRVSVAALDALARIFPEFSRHADNRPITIQPPSTGKSVVKAPSREATWLTPQPKDEISVEPPLRDNPMERIGGLRIPKNKLTDLAELFNDRDEALRDFGIRPNRHFMIYGPPGVGKTSLVDAFSQLVQAELMTVDKTRFAKSYLGQSAESAKIVFEEAKEASRDQPVVLFFDELDSIVRGKSKLHDEYQKVINVFKTEIDDVSNNYPNLIIAATSNERPESFDAGVLRAGRIEPIEAMLPTLDELIEIWAIKCQSHPLIKVSTTWNLDPASFADIESAAPEPYGLSELAQATVGMTGSDIHEIIEAARMHAYLQRRRTGTTPDVDVSFLLRQVTDYRKAHTSRLRNDPDF